MHRHPQSMVILLPSYVKLIILLNCYRIKGGKMSENYQICARCIMDTTDPDIEFDENGICNHCRGYDKLARKYVFTGKEGEQKLGEIVDKIKEQGENQEYDCIMGLSGGVDSTYTAYLAKQLGLRPLAVHLDNGWDSEIAAKNIEHIVKKLDLNLYTYLIDWNEFRDLQLAYFKASVVDIEAVTDHAIIATWYNIANERGIKYIVSGTNIVTEGIMPESWFHYKYDLKNLEAVHNQFGTVKLKTFPRLGVGKQLYYQYIKNIKSVSILNYIPYVKKDAKKLIAQELDWKDYGAKHYESIFTRFYQAYILPRKFNIDKRKAHLSSLICSGQIMREDALEEIKKDLYAKEDLEKDKEYVLKKLGLANEEFEKIMNLPVKSHFDYESDIKWLGPLRFIYRIFN